MSPAGGGVRGATEGGVAGDHRDLPLLDALVAPATGDELNTLRPSIIPLACWKIEDLRFEFGSSLIVPEAKRDLPLLAELLDAHTKPVRGAGRPRAAAPGARRAAVFG